MCVIFIDDVSGAPVSSSGRLQSVTVTGTVVLEDEERCDTVTVTIRCGDRTIQSDVVVDSSTGVWSHIFDVKDLGWLCGERMTTIAACKERPECRATRPHTEVCPEPPPRRGPCPVVQSITPDPQACVDVGGAQKRRVNFSALVTLGDANVTPDDVGQYNWNFGDGETLALAGPAGPRATHDYTVPADRTFTVTLAVRGTGLDAQGFECINTGTTSVLVNACASTPPPRPSENGNGGEEDEKHWLCVTLEAVFMIAFLLALIAGQLVAVASVTGAVLIPAGGPAAGWLFLGIFMVVIQFLLQHWLLFLVIAAIALVIWILTCHPTECRIGQDILWCFWWAWFLLGFIMAVYAFFASAIPGLGLIVIPVVFIQSMFYVVGRIVLKNRGCQEIDYFSLPWLRP